MVKVRFFEKNGSVWLDFRHAGKRYRRSSGEKTEAEARKVAPLIIRQTLPRAVSVAKTTQPKRSVLTMKEAFDRAHEVRESWIKSKAKHSLKSTFDCLLRASPGLNESSPVSILTNENVLKYRAAWLGEGGQRIGSRLSAGTINHRLSMLSTLLEVAGRPPHKVKHLSTKGNRRKRRISDHEIAQMHEWCRQNVHRLGATDLSDLITLAMETGARQGELLRLTWPDCSNGMVTFRNTKNFETRTVPLTQQAQLVLKGRRHLRRPFMVLAKNQLVALWAHMRSAMGLAGDKDFVFHALRHESLSRLADRGTNAFTLQAIAGHSSVSTTQVYVKANLTAMAQAMGSAVGPAAAPRGVTKAPPVALPLPRSHDMPANRLRMEVDGDC